MNTKKFLLLIGLLTISYLAYAEPVGTAFTYQGELNQQNAPATGIYDFQFNLYDVEVNGAAITSPVQLENIDVLDGVFTVELDFGAGVFNGTQLWLEIAVREGASVATHTTLNPRQKLTSSPYSLEASAIITGESCGAGSSLIGYQADGSLSCACLPGFNQCGDSCPDLMKNSAHCGTCGNVCSEGLECVNGSCRECDPNTQSCTETGDACYVNLGQRNTICNPPAPENGSGVQGDNCKFLNGCAKGFGCVLLNETQDGNECAKLCNFDHSLLGSAVCEANLGVGFRCVRSNDFYANLDMGDDIGFCVGPEWIP